MDRNKLAGNYSLVLSIIGIALSLFYSIFYLIFGITSDTEGFGAMYLIFAIVLFILYLVLLFSSFAIIKNKIWGKIVTLIIFCLLTLVFALNSYAWVGAIYSKPYPSFQFYIYTFLFLVNLIGIIFVSLSFKKSKK